MIPSSLCMKQLNVQLTLLRFCQTWSGSKTVCKRYQQLEGVVLEAGKLCLSIADLLRESVIVVLYF